MIDEVLSAVAGLLLVAVGCAILSGCANLTNAANALVADSQTAVADISKVVEAAGCDITKISPITTATVAATSDAAGVAALAVVDGLGNTLCILGTPSATVAAAPVK